MRDQTNQPTYRSLQSSLLGVWNTYRGLIEDPIVYTINPDGFLQTNIKFTEDLYHLFSGPDTILQQCCEQLLEMRTLLKVFLDRFDDTLQQLQVLQDPSPSGSTKSSPTSSPRTMSATLNQHPAMVQQSTSTTTTSTTSPLHQPLNISTSNLPQYNLTQLSLDQHSQTTQQSTISQDHVLSERLQHDLINLTVQILCGLMHHNEYMPPVLPVYDLGQQKRQLQFLIHDTIYLLWWLFVELVTHKDKFVYMTNQLIKRKILFVAIHCVVNPISQVIATKALSFLRLLIHNDDKMTMLFLQSYDVLNILQIRFQFLVNIDLLQSMQATYSTNPLNNSAELALRVKPTLEPLQQHHLEPFYQLLQFYQQLLTSITNTYSIEKPYVDDDFIYALNAQVLFTIRYLQLLATQYNLLYHTPTLSTAIPSGLTIMANRTLYITQSPLTAIIDPKLVQPANNSSSNQHTSMNMSLLSGNASMINGTNNNSIMGTSFQQRPTSAGGDLDMNLSMNQSQTKFVIMDGRKKPIANENTTIVHVNAANNNKPTTPESRYSYQQIIVLRPLLQLTVDLLTAVSLLGAKYENIRDIFLARDIGIIPSAIKLAVAYKLERPLTSFSPSVGTK